MFRKQSHLLRANGRGIGKESTTPKGVTFLLVSLPVVASYRRQPWAGKSTTPMVLVHVHRFPNKHPSKKRNPPKRNRRGGAYVPARTSAQRRFHTKNTCIVRWEWMMDAPLQGDTGGHTGTAPTKLHHNFPRNPTQIK